MMSNNNNTYNSSSAPVFWDAPQYIYEEDPVVTSMSAMPRFHHSKDFLGLVDDATDNRLKNTDITSLFTASLSNVDIFTRGDTSEAVYDYGKGIQFIFLVILVPFIFWSGLLLLFKMFGLWKGPNNKLGILSGNAFTFLDVADDKNVNSKTSNEKNKSRWYKRVAFTRFIFIIACFFIIAFSFVITLNGSLNLDATKTIVSEANDKVEQIVNEVIDITNNLNHVGGIGTSIKGQLIFDFRREEKICPLDPDLLRLPSEENNSTTTTTLTKGQQIFTKATAVRELLRTIGNFNQTQALTFRDAIEDLKHNVEQFQDVIHTLEDTTTWIFIVIIGPLILISSLFIFKTIYVSSTVVSSNYHLHHHYFTNFTDYIVLPIFIMLITTSFIICSFSAVLAVSNADFCSAGNTHTGQQELAPFAANNNNSTVIHKYSNLPTPDKVMMSLMDRSDKYNETNFVYQSVRYYINQCTKDAQTDPFVSWREYNTHMNQASQLVSSLYDVVDESKEEFTLLCNADFELTVTRVGIMNNILKSLYLSSARALQLLDCSRIVPVYTNIMYDIICSHNIKSLVIIFISFLVISLNGMIIITLRSSYHTNNVITSSATEQQSLVNEVEKERDVSETDVLEAYKGDEGDASDDEEKM